MKYKVVLVVISILLLLGCSSTPKEDILECDMGNTVITLTIREGKIIKYVDKIRGELLQDEIDVLNQSHLQDIEDNKAALTKLRGVIATSGGDCK